MMPKAEFYAKASTSVNKQKTRQGSAFYQETALETGLELHGGCRRNLG